MKKPEKLSSEYVLDDFLKVEKAYFREDGEEYDRLIVRRQDAAGILLYNTQEEKFVFVKQFRAPLHDFEDPFLLEIPAGLLDEGEAPDEAIIRETLEETGYKMESPEKINTFFTTAGYSNEQCHLFYGEVTNEAKVEEGGGTDNESENITIVEIPEEETMQMLLNHKLSDAKTLLALWWYYANKYRKKTR